MPLTFYPHSDETQKGSLDQRIEVLMEAAEQYKAIILDTAKQKPTDPNDQKKQVPREQIAAFNWEEISRVLREIRESPEGSRADKLMKSQLLNKLAEVYEVLRGAKMSKLEAVRLALKNEANQLQSGNTQGV